MIRKPKFFLFWGGREAKVGGGRRWYCPDPGTNVVLADFNMSHSVSIEVFSRRWLLLCNSQRTCRFELVDFYSLTFSN